MLFSLLLRVTVHKKNKKLLLSHPQYLLDSATAVFGAAGVSRQTRGSFCPKCERGKIEAAFTRARRWTNCELIVLIHTSVNTSLHTGEATRAAAYSADGHKMPPAAWGTLDYRMSSLGCGDRDERLGGEEQRIVSSKGRIHALMRSLCHLQPRDGLLHNTGC